MVTSHRNNVQSLFSSFTYWIYEVFMNVRCINKTHFFFSTVTFTTVSRLHDYYRAVIKMPSRSHCRFTAHYHRITVIPGLSVTTLSAKINVILNNHLHSFSYHFTAYALLPIWDPPSPPVLSTCLLAASTITWQCRAACANSTHMKTQAACWEMRLNDAH